LNSQPVEGGSANDYDYDYVGGDPCNSYDLNGAWANPYKKAQWWRRAAMDMASKYPVPHRNAIRHCVGTAGLRWEFGRAITRLVTTAHEVEGTARSKGRTIGDSIADTRNNRVAMRIGGDKRIGRDRRSARKFIVESCDSALYGPTRWGQLDTRPE
jgi:hypothetical protein